VTVLLNAGVPAKVIQEMLGHSSIKVTMDGYAAVLPLIQDAAAEVMDAILAGGRDPARDGGDDGVC
jgi:integrase